MILYKQFFSNIVFRLSYWHTNMNEQISEVDVLVFCSYGCTYVLYKEGNIEEAIVCDRETMLSKMRRKSIVNGLLFAML